MKVEDQLHHSAKMVGADASVREPEYEYRDSIDVSVPQSKWRRERREVGPWELVPKEAGQEAAYMPVPRCETCAHWARFVHPAGKEDRGPIVPAGRCLVAKHRHKRGEVPKIGGCPDTADDFGCVLWEPDKEAL